MICNSRRRRESDRASESKGERQQKKKRGRSCTYKKRECRGEETSQESIGSNSTRRVSLECIDKIIQRRLEDGEEANADHDTPHLRREPVHTRRRRPREDEQAGGEDHRADHHGRQSRLGHRSAVVGFEPLLVVLLVEDVDGASGDDTE